MIKQEQKPQIFRLDCSPLKRQQFKWEFFRFVIFNYYLIEAVLSSSFYSMYLITETSLMPLNIIFFIYMIFDFAFKISFTPKPEFKKLEDYKKPGKILKYYFIRKLLLLDLIFLVLFISSYILPFSISRFFRLVILIKLFDVVDFNNQIYQKIHIYPIARKVYTIFKITYVILLFSHYFGTWFYLIDQILIDQQFYGTPAEGNQLYYQMNLLAYTPIQQLDNWGRYLYGLYFMVSLITTIAYGDIIGKNAYEEVYVSVLMILSTISLALILQQFMDFVRYDSLGLYDFIKNYNSLKTCMDDSQVTYKVQNRVRSYLVYAEYEKKYHAHEQVAQKLTQKLQSDLKSESYSEAVQSWIIPCMPELSGQVESISNLCVLVSFQAQTDIYEELKTVQTASQCSFLYKIDGMVQQFIELSRSRVRLPIKRKRQFNLSRLLLNFNIDVAYDSDEEDEQEFKHEEEEEITPKKYHLVNANSRGLKSIKISQFILLDAEQFYELVNTKKNWVKRIKHIRQQILSRDLDYRLIDDSCQLCRDQSIYDHTIQECPTMHLTYNPRTATSMKVHDVIYQSLQRAKHQRKGGRSKKSIGVSLFQKNIFSFYMKPVEEKPTIQKQLIVNVFKNILGSMKDPNKKSYSQIDSTYDPVGLSEQYYLQQNEN